MRGLVSVESSETLLFVSKLEILPHSLASERSKEGTGSEEGRWTERPTDRRSLSACSEPDCEEDEGSELEMLQGWMELE